MAIRGPAEIASTRPVIEGLGDDRRRAAILPILRETYGDSEARRWYHRWRIFFMACAALFGYRGGEEWFVSHYLFGRRR